MIHLYLNVWVLIQLLSLWDMEHNSYVLYKTDCEPGCPGAILLLAQTFSVRTAHPLKKKWIHIWFLNSVQDEQELLLHSMLSRVGIYIVKSIFFLTRTIALFCSTLASLIMTRMKLVTAVTIAPMCTTLLRLTQTTMGRVTHVLWTLMEMVWLPFWELGAVPQVHFALWPVRWATCFYMWNKIGSSSSKM